MVLFFPRTRYVPFLRFSFLRPGTLNKVWELGSPCEDCLLHIGLDRSDRSTFLPYLLMVSQSLSISVDNRYFSLSVIYFKLISLKSKKRVPRATLVLCKVYLNSWEGLRWFERITRRFDLQIANLIIVIYYRGVSPGRSWNFVDCEDGFPDPVSFLSNISVLLLSREKVSWSEPKYRVNK